VTVRKGAISVGQDGILRGDWQAPRVPVANRHAAAKLSRMACGPQKCMKTRLIGGGRSVRWTAARGSGIPLTRGGFRPCPTKGQLHAVAVLARDACLRHYGRSCALADSTRGQLWRSNRRIHSRASCHPNGTSRDGVRAAPDQGPATSLPELSCRHPSSGAAFFIEEIKHMLQNHGAKGSPEGVRDVRRRTRMPNKGSAADTRG